MTPSAAGADAAAVDAADAADADAPWLDDREQAVWRQWIQVSGRLPAALHRDLQRSSDLSLPDFDVLVRLTESDEGRMRVSALATSLQWERSRLSHHVGRMGRRGLVEREDCVDDARGAFIAVTEAGRAAIERAAPDHVRTVRSLVFDALGEDEVAAFGAVMTRILSRLDAVEG